MYDLKENIERLECYENWHASTKLDFENIVDSDLWNEHWENHKSIIDKMRKSQKLAEKIKGEIERYIKTNS